MSEAQRLHGHLIGQQGSRRSLNTPALVLDLEMLERNIAEMASFAKAHDVKLRPHSKTHKSADIARRQIAAGALGVCCAKLGEAEALGEAGIQSLHVTSPVVTPQAIDRLMKLNGEVSDLMVVVDHPANVEALANAAAKVGKPLAVIVDIDPGIHRTGVDSPEAAVELVQQIVKLRPHSKTHKSADNARRQMAAGALGVCCAKLGEAEALGEAGIQSLHITSPVVTPQGIDRLMKLNGEVSDLMVVVDHPANVEALAAAAAKAGKPLTVIVDIDPGIHRTGTATPEATVELVQKIANFRSLAYAGVQFYCGRHQHIVDFAQRKAEIEERTEYLKGILAKLDAANLKPAIITGSGTGTHYIDAKLGVFTELQVGSYVFMDHDYNVCDLRGLDKPTFEQALQIDARVVSANKPGMATVDAGLKAMATEMGPPVILKGAVDGATTRFMGDEHLAVIAPDGKAAPALAEQVILTPPHCDPTVNLYESYHVVKGDTLVEIWPVTARGRSR